MLYNIGSLLCTRLCSAAVFILFSALCAKAPYCVLHSSVLIIQCFVCEVSLLCTAQQLSPHLLVLYMQNVHIVYSSSVLVIQCFMCKVSILCTAHQQCQYYSVLCMQSVLIVYCTTAVSLLFSALYAKCPYNVLHSSSVLYMQRVLLCTA